MSGLLLALLLPVPQVPEAERYGIVVTDTAGDTQAVPVLTSGLSDPEPLVRGHAAWALSVIGSPAAIAALRARAAVETDPLVVKELAAHQRNYDSSSRERGVPCREARLPASLIIPGRFSPAEPGSGGRAAARRRRASMGGA